MTNRRRFELALVGLAVVGAVALPVLAQSKSKTHKQIVQAMKDSAMTLTQAIEKAEKEANGQAIGARAEIVEDALRFTVQCSVGDETHAFHVDAKTGKVSDGDRRAPRKEDKPGKGKGNEIKPREGGRQPVSP